MNIPKIPPQRFELARSILKDQITHTPLIKVASLSKEQPLFLKVESLQLGGSFKIRGASFCLSQLSEEQRKRGVVAFSTGNHAQGVALAARHFGIKATIVMSPEVPSHKIEATKKYGAEVVIVPSEKRKKYAEELAASEGKPFIPPYDHLDVITGQGTIGLEILDEIEPQAVFVPVGGGGLIAGIAMAIKQKCPHVKIIGVEPKLEDDAVRSFATGTLQCNSKISASIADAVKVPSLGELTFPLLMHYVDEMISVSEEEIIEATLKYLETHLIVEPSGALSLAGAWAYPGLLPKKPIVCVVSGGNTTLPFLQSLQG